MWPEDFLNWWPPVRPLVVQTTYTRLAVYRLLTADRRSLWRVRNVAIAAARATFDRAEQRQAYPAYFPDQRRFRLWAVASGYYEALRLLPEQELVRPWFDQLTGENRVLLLWSYVEQLTDRQLAEVRTETPAQARAAVLGAYRVLCGLLRANQWGHDDDPLTFPLPPILFGFA